ncbi:MAG: hypothetical protein QM749_10545 [Aquabacterium sp.]
MTIINKLLALASTLAVSAYAMVTLGDQEMGMVNAQDGITLSGKLDIQLGSFSYVEPDSDYLHFLQLHTQGSYARQYEILPTLPQQVQEEMPGITANGDVLAVTLPALTQQVLLAPTLSVSVEAITVGNSKPSMGSIQINNIDLQGSRRWTWSH